MPRLRQAAPPLRAATAPAAALLAWYDRHRRDLPWRARPGEVADPYRVWLSEIMLQQTTVEAVKPFYAAFLTRWPDLPSLAAAPLAEIMRSWAGLGYYSRARNLHACAQLVAERHGGAFPSTEAELRALPGIGAYTAAAIAAIAFGQDAVVVDGNVERVMARLHAIEEPLPRARPKIAAAMAALTPAGHAGDFAQAVMDLGSGICAPRNPACAICPVRPFCRASALACPTAFPVRERRKEQPTRFGAAFYVEDAAGRVLVRDRPPHGLLGGTAELPGTAWTAETLPAGGDVLGTVVHVFTHFRLDLSVLRAEAGQLSATALAETRWVARADLPGEAFSTLMRNALAVAEDAATRRLPSASRRHRRS